MNRAGRKSLLSRIRGRWQKNREVERADKREFWDQVDKEGLDWLGRRLREEEGELHEVRRDRRRPGKISAQEAKVEKIRQKLVEGLETRKRKLEADIAELNHHGYAPREYTGVDELKLRDSKMKELESINRHLSELKK